MIKALFVIALIVSLNIFPLFVQTVKNLLLFIFIVILIAILLWLSFAIEFLPLAYLIVYVSAVIINMLFVILSFNLKFEYQTKRSFIQYWAESIIVNNILSAAVYTLFLFTSRIAAYDEIEARFRAVKFQSNSLTKFYYLDDSYASYLGLFLHNGHLLVFTSVALTLTLFSAVYFIKK